jgi:hypothetical protein
MDVEAVRTAVARQASRVTLGIDDIYGYMAVTPG